MLVRTASVVQVGTSATGVPTSLVWDGARYRVSDRPTRWRGRGDEWDFGADDAERVAFPVLWRFQASPTSDRAASTGAPDAPVVVDVVTTGDGWVLLGVVH